MPRPLVRWAFLAFALACVPAARAQVYAFERYGAEAGVPGAHALAFDADGVLLVGTAAGLLRFDGHGFEPVPLPGGVDARVRRLTTGTDGVVWALADGGRLFHMAPGAAAEAVPVPAALAPALTAVRWTRRLRTDAAGRLWTNDDVGGLWRRDAATGAWARLDAGVPVVDFFAEPDGTLWLAARDRIGHVAPGATRVRWTTALAHVVFLRPHPRGAWVGTNAGDDDAPRFGVYLLDRAGGLRPARGLRERFQAWHHAEAAADADGRLLVAGGYAGGQIGLVRLGPDGALDLAADVAHGWTAVPYGMLFDAEGALWVAAETGLAHLAQEHLVAVPLVAPDGTPESALMVGVPGRPYARATPRYR